MQTSGPAAYFYPRPPRGGRRVTYGRNGSEQRIFLSTPSARRATSVGGSASCRSAISIHALREEGDCQDFHGFTSLVISIHALREEGDTRVSVRSVPPPLFLSTPSARRATACWCPWDGRGRISIHALREEGDTRVSVRSVPPPLFLSTPSARRATCRRRPRS